MAKLVTKKEIEDYGKTYGKTIMWAARYGRAHLTDEQLKIVDQYEEMKKSYENQQKMVIEETAQQPKGDSKIAPKDLFDRNNQTKREREHQERTVPISANGKLLKTLPLAMFCSLDIRENNLISVKSKNGGQDVLLRIFEIGGFEKSTGDLKNPKIKFFWNNKEGKDVEMDNIDTFNYVLDFDKNLNFIISNPKQNKKVNAKAFLCFKNFKIKLNSYYDIMNLRFGKVENIRQIKDLIRLNRSFNNEVIYTSKVEAANNQ